MRILRKIISSNTTKWAFLVVALTGLFWYIYKNWTGLVAALSRLPIWMALLSAALALIYVLFTLLSWKTLLSGLGTNLNMNVATQLFGVSQIGKYIPGGVWNIVAATQIGKRHKIPAHRSVTAMTIAVLVSLVSGTGIGMITLLGTSASVQIPTWVIIILFIALCALLTPPILNKLIQVCYRVLKFPIDEVFVTGKSLGISTLYSLLAWVIAGVQIWLLGIGFGMQPTIKNFFLATGAYALAWVIGFIVVFIPAGTGVRESILGLFLAGTLNAGGVLAIVIVSRIAMTIADLFLAGLGALLAKRDKSNQSHFS